MLREESEGSDPLEQEKAATLVQLPVSLSSGEYEELSQRIADLQVSPTDPDATLMLTKNGADLGYHTHYVVDGGKASVILEVLVTPKARDGQSNRCSTCSGVPASVGSCGRDT